MMNRMKRLDFIKAPRLGVFEDILAAISMAGLAFMMFFAVADVTGRYLLNSPIVGAHDILEPLMSVIVLLCLGFAQRTGVHVGVDILEERVKKERVRRGIRLFDLVLPLVLFIIITSSSFEIALDAYKRAAIFPGLLGLPSAPFLFCVPLGSLVLCLRFVVQIRTEVQAIIRATRKLGLEEEKIAKYQP